MADLHTRELFGSAISMGLPASLLDMSDLRPIPDHQEVWADRESDLSVIIEIVEATATDNAKSAAFYYQDLAQLNESRATSVQVQHLEPLATPKLAEVPGLYTSLAFGTQSIKRGRPGQPEEEQRAKDVLVVLAVIRLPQVASDLLITVTTSPQSASGADAATAETEQGHAHILPLTLKMLSTVEIRDWGLFGGDP